MLAIESNAAHNTGMAPVELLILRVLMDNPRGLHGTDILRVSNGGMARGTLYVQLARTQERGWIRSVDETCAPAHRAPRRLYLPTAEGLHACRQFVDACGLRIVDGFFAQR